MTSANGCDAQSCSGPLIVSRADLPSGGPAVVVGRTPTGGRVSGSAITFDGGEPFVSPRWAVPPAAGGGPLRVGRSALQPLAVPPGCEAPWAGIIVTGNASPVRHLTALCGARGGGGAGQLHLAVSASTDGGRSWAVRTDGGLQLVNAGLTSAAAADRRPPARRLRGRPRAARVDAGQRRRGAHLAAARPRGRRCPSGDGAGWAPPAAAPSTRSRSAAARRTGRATTTGSTGTRCGCADVPSPARGGRPCHPVPMTEPASPPVTYPAQWEADVVLRDGSVAHVRPIRPEDADGIRRFHAGQSAESIYLRFFAPLQQLSDRDVAPVHRRRLPPTGSPSWRRCATRSSASAATTASTATTAEVAFNISDAYQGRGIGSVLLEHLAAIAPGGGRRAGSSPTSCRRTAR